MSDLTNPTRRELLTVLAGLSLASLTGCGGGAGTPAPTAVPATSLLIPAYFFDPLLWAQILPAHTPAHTLIVNVATGPGTTLDSVWQGRFNTAKANGHRLIGYVDTTFAARAANLVQADITAWQTLYGITDIFFDQVSSLPADIAYYQNLLATIRTRIPNARIILNCGAVPDLGYFKIDTLTEVVIFESTWTLYQAQTFPATLTPYWSRSHLMVNTAPTAALTSVHNFAGAHGAAGYFVTDMTTMNYTTSLPSYWAAELAL